MSISHRLAVIATGKIFSYLLLGQTCTPPPTHTHTPLPLGDFFFKIEWFPRPGSEGRLRAKMNSYFVNGHTDRQTYKRKVRNSTFQSMCGL